MKRQRGFTLVEIIVTAVIVAVLALAGVQLYRGWVVQTSQDTVEELAQTAAASANAYFRKTGNHPPDAATLNLFLPDPTRYTVTVNSGATPPEIEVTDTKYGVTGTATY
jgi:prepilin-type N-terminal cleavage/methylation domain-containing protein